MRPTFWRDRRVLITGHTGFKGSWLALWLEHLGARVTGIALEPARGPNLFRDASVARGMRSLMVDLRDLSALTGALREARPEVVLHLAAQSLVHHGYRHPVETYATNVMGTVQLLEAVRRTPSVRAVVCVTSDKCYENPDRDQAFSEEDRLGGRDPYSNSKACAELATEAYRRSFFEEGDERATAVATARSGNVIGGGDWAADRLVPDLMRGILAGQPVKVRRPDATRPWQHVLEPLGGYLDLAEALCKKRHEHTGAWNFGPGTGGALPVRRIADGIVERWGEPAAWILDEDPFPPEARYLRLDVSKARERLGWTPRIEVDTTLDWIVEWYRGYESGAHLRDLTLAQIERFQSGMAS